MSSETKDFGKSLLPIPPHSAFFLDTNVIIAFVDKKNSQHLPVAHFLMYLIAHHTKLYVSDTVIQEVIHTLAKFYFAEDKLQQTAVSAGISARQRKEIRTRFERSFIKVTKPRLSYTPAQVEACKKILRLYNSRAIRTFEPFLKNFCVILHSTDDQINLALNLCLKTPLHSSDAMIAASAILHHDTLGLITLDRDMTALTEIDVYYTEVRNQEFALQTLPT